MPNWTKSQLEAIESRNGSILVSAAAGSGKTSVLVERILRRITEDGGSIEKMLVVTFTKAAAEDMKDKLSKKLIKLMNDNPENISLRRQKIYLADAQICTIDSFCNTLVKENYASLNLHPDFKMLQDSEHDMLKREVIEEVLEELYEKDDEGIAELLNIFSDGKNDDKLVNFILNTYEYAMADANPEFWIKQMFSSFDEDIPLEKTLCGEYAYGRLHDNLTYMLRLIDDLYEDTNQYDNIREKLVKKCCLPIKEAAIKTLEMIENKEDWDSVRSSLKDIKMQRSGSFKDFEKDEIYFDARYRTDIIKKKLQDCQNCMISSSEEYIEDIRYLRPVMGALENTIKVFMSKLAERKAEDNAYYFSDILHFCLKLLVNFDENNEPQATDLAKEISKNYDEILIDEFQDTNKAQVCLFNAISKTPDNKFMVGDVKQSIYAFRYAMPDVFVEIADKLNKFEGDNYPAKIMLDRNFRSREGLVNGINFFFDFLMTRKLGDVNYKNDERLTFGADEYDENTKPCVEVHMIDKEVGTAVNNEKESIHVANLINEIVSSGMTVGKGEEKHKVSYRDICILMRKVKNKAAETAGILSSMNIPVYYEKKDGFFSDSDVVTAISLLRVIDNPVQDVPLLSVLLSPIYPFTETDIAALRCKNRNSSIYYLLKNNYDNDEKIRSFIDMIDKFRTLSVTLRVSELIRRIYEETGLDSIAESKTNGNNRVLNLRKLVDIASSLETSGSLGLSSFVRFIDKMRENGTEIGAANDISEEDDVVRIMTIHKSKGLEFPIVIIMNMDSSINTSNKHRIIVNRKIGVGAYRWFENSKALGPTQTLWSAKGKNKDDEYNETMRLLYVAMTRAKEKLYLVGSVYKIDDSIPKLYKKTKVPDDIRHVALKDLDSTFKWVCSALASSSSMNDFDFIQKIPDREITNTDTFIKVLHIEDCQREEIAVPETEAAKANDDLVELIKEKVEYSYPYEELATLPIKYSASSIDQRVSSEYFATDIPSFESAESMPASQRGTLIHRFMELSDFDNASKSIKDELSRLIQNGHLNLDESDIVEKSKIESFFKSDMYKRILESDQFLREQEFTMSTELPVLDPTLKAYGENVIVQGIMDGLMINGEDGEVIDYKTDRISDPDKLVDRYREQMRVYKLAAEKCFNLKNVTVTIYSFHMGKEISVNF